MKRTALALIMALSISAVAGIQFVFLVMANPIPPPPNLAHIYIRNDGSVDPSTAPIQRVGDIYTLTYNIYNYSIEVQCDNIIIDGAGYTLQGNRSNGIEARGVQLSERSNVTVRNLKIKTFEYGVTVSFESVDNSIVGNHITDCRYGVCFSQNSGNSITENFIANCSDGVEFVASASNNVDRNNFTNNGRGFYLHNSPYNTLSRNKIDNSGDAVWLIGSSHNILSGNNISNNGNALTLVGSLNNSIIENIFANNGDCIKLREWPENNVFYHNCFIDNAKLIIDECYGRPLHGGEYLGNIWDNCSEGNYWSDYNGADNNDDGIGDSSYIIDEANRDNYPLMEPVIIPVSIMGYSAFASCSNHTDHNLQTKTTQNTKPRIILGD